VAVHAALEPLRRLGDALGGVEGRHHRRQAVGDGGQHALEGIERAQHEHGELDARRAQRDALLDGGHAQPVGGAGLLGRARAELGAVAVGVGLDHEHELGGAGLAAERAEVGDQRAGVDLGPGGAEEAPGKGHQEN
jgi:hypothetical protein